MTATARGAVLKMKWGTKWGPDTRLYETSIETSRMDHFIQKVRVHTGRPVRVNHDA